MLKFIGKMAGGSPLPPRPAARMVWNGLIGGLLGISVIAILTQSFGLPFMMAPLGATCVLLFAAPDAPLAQPRNVIVGHLLSSFVGIVVAKYLGVTPLYMGLAVGAAIALMQVTRTLHAPAGADPLVILLAGGADWDFLFMPVTVSSVILVAIALVLNNASTANKWPKYW
ncbi:MAG: HPP family protein [Hafnia sp.]|uniref:HPP family protein n=1 Tax=Pseudomonas fontis TaxID=2942633 RepID=A0ABT5NNT0_9PSED|nr:HPP family protein [Pseudomonas fontis]MDD0973035.1 HPP family protein [Pseudomonas fontis]MDD0989804.1 HPP family protein [Pseudomonas fontis]